MFVSRHVSRPLSRVPSPCRHSRMSLPCRCHSSSHLLLTPPSHAFLEPIDYQSFFSHLAPVWKKARVLVPITSNAIVTCSYGGYCVAISSRDSSNSEPKPARVENYCIVACREPQLQSCRNSRDEMLVKKIFARDSSSTLVALATADNEIVYSTQCCRFPSFEKCAVKQFKVRRTAARALDVLAAKPLSWTTPAPVHDSCATLLATDVICTRDCRFASHVAH